MGLDIYFNKTKKETDEIGYFRKVNFLVSFFENFESIENLRPIIITKEMCEELLNRCKKVLEDHSLAEELLPTCPGFFFGNYNYDDYYFKDVEEVRKYVEKVLLPEYNELEPDENIEFQIWY